MNTHKVPIWLILVLTAVLSGCSLMKPTTQIETFDLNEKDGENRGLSLTTDATRRAITNVDIVNTSVPGQVVPKRIVCAEPSPDVAETFSKAVEVAVAASKGGASASTNVSASTSQSLAQLGERLATVQLLRDMAYRNCEAYANGSINATSYTILNSRLNKTIVTLLSTEVVAGAFGRNLAVILGSAKSESNAKASGSKNNKEKPSTTSDTNTSGKTEAKGQAAGTSVDGQIAGQQQTAPTSVAAQIAQIHRNFIEDSNFVTLIDACVAHMNNIPVEAQALDEATKINDRAKAIELAKAYVKQSPFTKICIDKVLPEAVKLAKAKSASEDTHKQLQVIEKIIDTCKDDKTKDTPGCKNLDKLLGALKK